MAMNGYDGPPPFMEGFLAWAGSLPMPVYGVLALLGAIIGFVYGVEQPAHHPQYLYAILGGFAGLILIPAIAMLIRFAIQCVIVALLGLAAYYAFFKP
jgi:hypothetical protein